MRNNQFLKDDSAVFSGFGPIRSKEFLGLELLKDSFASWVTIQL
jgi:hypothetical protein